MEIEENNMLILNWIKMKRLEIKLRLRLYSFIDYVLKDNTDIIKIMENCYEGLKDVSSEDMANRIVEEVVKEVVATSKE